MSGDWLRRLWDFDDLEATGARLGNQLEAETDDGGRAEVLTQLARLQGLREEFRAGEAVLRRAEGLAGNSRVARIRIDLERGRLLRSSGDSAAALPLFVSAYDAALEAGGEFIAADAAHMAALAAPDREERLARTRRGIDVAGSTGDRDVAYWMGPLLNNLGVEYSDGEREAALEAFERALEVRLRYPENPAANEFARKSVAEARRALGRD